MFCLRPDAPNNLGGYLGGFSDWFRYELLHARGGWWVDTDVICQRPFVGRGAFMFGSAISRSGSHFVDCNVIYSDRPGSEFLSWCASFARERGDRIVNAETGPLLLDRALRERGMFGFVVHPRLFNPIDYHDVRLLLWPRPKLDILALRCTIRGLRPVYSTAPGASISTGRWPANTPPCARRRRSPGTATWRASSRGTRGSGGLGAGRTAEPDANSDRLPATRSPLREGERALTGCLDSDNHGLPLACIS